MSADSGGLHVVLEAIRSLLQEARDGSNPRVADRIPDLEALYERFERENLERQAAQPADP